MIKIENFEATGFEHAIRGMRNPMNSWEKSDTDWFAPASEEDVQDYIEHDPNTGLYHLVGHNDLELMTKLAKGGPVHAKYRRMITVYVDITAPLYWWKEFDTYKVGTVANSCSTMHKIHEKEFTMEDFSTEHLFGPKDMDVLDSERYEIEKDNALAAVNVDGDWCYFTPKYFVQMTCDILNRYRSKFLETKKRIKDFDDTDTALPTNELKQLRELAKKYWWQMIQLLPSSYNQKRTVMLNYEVLHNIYTWRKNHKLDEWVEFCKWIKTLPYSEIITMEEKEG